MEFYKCKVKYYKAVEGETNKFKSTTETHLLNALSYTEAEARIIKEMEGIASSGVSVRSIGKTNIDDLWPSKNDGLWFKIIVADAILDDKGNEKCNKYTHMVQATDFHEAYKFIVGEMKKTNLDWFIQSITETDIVDIYNTFI